MKDETVGLLAIIAIIIFGLWVFQIWPFNVSDNVTVYQTVCAQKRGACIKPLRPRQRVFYKVFPEEQIVVWWPDTGVSKFPKKYTGCTVIDAQNWICQSAGVYMHMNNGRLASFIDADGRKALFVSKLCWHLMHVFSSSMLLTHMCEG